MPQGWTVISANKTVAASGTPEALTATDTHSPVVIIQALKDNGSDVFVGNEPTVSAGAKIGQRLTPGSSLTLEAPDIRGTDENLNLNTIFLDVTTSTEGVSYLYLKKS